MKSDIYAEPRNVTSLEDCHFYHTMDIPGYGTVQGAWDLRGREESYLGNVDLKGKRVLEIGTASGHMCFAMEKKGAEVVTFDLSEEQEWDVVPYEGREYKNIIEERKIHIRKINNGFWLAHRKLNSKAKMVYGTVYNIPDDIGQFDIGILGSILLHLRDPFLAMQRISSHISETIIVTDIVEMHKLIPRKNNFPSHLLLGNLLYFLPSAKSRVPLETWWQLSPQVVVEFLKILGFHNTRILFHNQLHSGNEVKLFTIVAKREKKNYSEDEKQYEEKDDIGKMENDLYLLEEIALENMRISRLIRHIIERCIKMCL